MKHNLAANKVVVLILAILGVFGVHAEEKLVALKKGGVSHEYMWKEEDVEAYLRLPRLVLTDNKSGLAIDQMAQRIESTKTLAGYQLAKNHNDPLRLRSQQAPVASLELGSENGPVFYVSVYDYRAWNDMCDKLFSYITSTVEMWHRIPDYFVAEEGEDEYTLTCTTGSVQKWHFSLKYLYVMVVEGISMQKGLIGEEQVVAEVETIVRELVSLIEDEDEH